MFSGEITKDGYVYVGETPTGYGLFRKQNGAGGWSYYTDELSMIIYEPTLVNDYDILMAMADNHKLRQMEYHERVLGSEIYP